MLAQKLRKGAQKIKKANRGRWGTLSSGEKVLKVILTLLKLGIIFCCGSLVVCIIIAAWIAFGIMSGLTGAVNDQVQRSYDYHHRGRYY